MGIQIRGSDDNISASDGSLTINGASFSTLQVNGQNLPTAGPLSNRNLIINGNFVINQRGGSNTTINTYALDRWRSYGGPMGFTISQQDVLSTLSTSRYAMRFQRTSGNTQTNNTGVVQGIESKNCEGLAGTQLTLSFKARAGADLSDDLDARFFYGTGTDENPVSMTGMTNDGGTDFTLTTSFATYTKTVTVPASATQISLTFAVTPTGTAGANDWFEVAEVQVERGSVATPFEHRSYGDELLKCCRYFYAHNSGDTYNMVAHGHYGSSSLFIGMSVVPVPFRGVPSVSVTGNWHCAGDSASVDASNIRLIDVASGNSILQIRADCSGASSGEGTFLRNNNDATAMCYFNSEL